MEEKTATALAWHKAYQHLLKMLDREERKEEGKSGRPQ